MRKNKSLRKKLDRKPKLPAEEYQKLKFSAYEYVVVQGKTQKATAELLGITEQTVSEWARESGWKEQREGRQQSTRTEAENIRQIIRLNSERRLEIENEIAKAVKLSDKKLEAELRAEANRLSDNTAKWAKTLREMEKNNKYSLGELINMMDDLFTDMRQSDPELFEKTINFQQYYIRKKTNELG
ncbi:MAG: hypothetical protein VB066_01710 [Paludibacter sp.]|nr:hypothetical protein [Paludibacter sp.]